MKRLIKGIVKGSHSTPRRMQQKHCLKFLFTTIIEAKSNQIIHTTELCPMLIRNAERGKSNTRVIRPNSIKRILHSSLASVTLYDINPII